MFGNMSFVVELLHTRTHTTKKKRKYRSDASWTDRWMSKGRKGFTEIKFTSNS